MRFPVKTTVLVVLVAAGAAAYKPAMDYMKERAKVHFQEEEASKGTISYVVNSTGTVQPVLSVHIGSFVSGPIDKLFVDFNQPVKKGELLAKIDPRIYAAAVQQGDAVLATRKAEVERARALLQQAENDERRAMSLRSSNKDFVSETEMDQFRFNRISLAAQLKVADAGIRQAEASLETAKLNLNYCEITSPVDGIVIDRKIDPGQTLAAQFQTPELFIVAPDMKKEMYVFASVDEADIGLIRQAEERKQPVHFTVDAYPEDLFEGKIKEIRKSPTTTQNVVTYPVVVSAPNPDLKLLPGMTANLSFQVDEKKDVVRLPNASLRFYPRTELVRPEDRGILEGLAPKTDKEKESTEPIPSAQEKANVNRKRNHRHVWVVEGDLLRAVEVVMGINDSKFTELVSGDIKTGQKVVTGIQVPAVPGAGR